MRAILDNLKTADWMEAGFSLISLFQLRLYPADTTHVAVTVSEISHFNKRQYLEKNLVLFSFIIRLCPGQLDLLIS